MKKTMFSALATAACLLLAGGNVYAEALSFGTPEDGSGTQLTTIEPDTTFYLPVMLDTDANTAGASFKVTYDTSTLTMTGVSSGYFDTFTAQGISPASVEVDGETYDTPLIVGAVQNGGNMLAGARISNGNGDSAELFLLEFQVQADATLGDYAFGMEASVISNTDAGYSAEGEAIPMLVGIGDDNGTPTYPALYQQDISITVATLTIGASNPDTDGDGILDEWEMDNFGNLDTANATTDYDRDGYTDLQEFNYSQAGTTDPSGSNFDAVSWNTPGGAEYINRAVSSQDFNGDGVNDVLWRHETTGQVYIWLLDSSGSTIADQGSPGKVSLDWELVKTADVNNDGKSDIIWRNSNSGLVYIWLLDGTSITSLGAPGAVNLAYQIIDINDFNADGKADILWRNSTDGQVYIWLLDGTSIASQAAQGKVPLDWEIKTTCDMNNDGIADLLWRNQTTGLMYIWLMNGTTIASQGSPGLATSDWAIAITDDYNNDGNADIVWRHQTTGKIYVWLMNGLAILDQGTTGTVVLDWVIEGSADFDHDGQADLLLRHSTTGQVYIWLMDGTLPSGVGSPGTTDLSWQLKDKGYYNTDGKQDLLWRNITTGEVFGWLMDGTNRTSESSLGTINSAWKIQ